MLGTGEGDALVGDAVAQEQFAADLWANAEGPFKCHGDGLLTAAVGAGGTERLLPLATIPVHRYNAGPIVGLSKEEKPNDHAIRNDFSLGQAYCVLFIWKDTEQ